MIPNWIVNDNGELGVEVGGRFFFLYKGRSLEYAEFQEKDEGTLHDDGTPMLFRPVGKREFGETCWPTHVDVIHGRYTDGEGWRPLP